MNKEEVRKETISVIEAGENKGLNKNSPIGKWIEFTIIYLKKKEMK